MEENTEKAAFSLGGALEIRPKTIKKPAKNRMAHRFMAMARTSGLEPCIFNGVLILQDSGDEGTQENRW